MPRAPANSFRIPDPLHSFLGLSLVALAALVACSGTRNEAKKPAAPALVIRPLPSVTASRPPAAGQPIPARSHRVATIARRAIGPFVARAGDRGIAAWIAPAERGAGRDLAVVLLGADGAPLDVPRVVVSVPQEATALIVRQEGVGNGWLVAWSALLDRGESLTVLALAPDGTARGSPIDIERTNDHIRWADLLPTPHGVLCLWAEENQSGDADVLSQALDADGKPRGMSVRVVRGVERWQAVRASDGAGLAWVAGHTAGNDRPAAGPLTWTRLDVEGHPMGPPVTIGSSPTVGSDVEVVQLQRGWLLGWTDRTGEDAQVMLATVDAAGRVQGPKPALNAVGGSSLVALAAGAAGSALAWEEPRGRAHTLSTLHLASVSTEGDLSAQSMISFQIAARSTPELVATGGGFALLASASACRSPAPCRAPVTPTFVRFGSRLDPAQAEPLFLADHVRAATSWGLRCAEERCSVLAATNEMPTPIFTVDLPARTSPFAVPALSSPPSDAPRVTSIMTIASGQPFADIAVARLGNATVVATLTGAVDAPRNHGRGQASGATIALRVLDENGRPLGAPATLTSRAVSVGGVAIAPASRLEDGAAVAWVARDAADAHVHVAHLDRRGRRIQEVQLTTSGGGATSVAIVWAAGGWLVAWVDARDGNGEVYVTKIDQQLRRVAREERITNAPGDAGDVALAARDEVVWVAWSDPREDPREGLADIYASTLHARDATRASDEVRLLATAPHSRSPKIAIPADGRALVGWIEDSPMGLDAPGAAMVAHMDDGGRVVGAPTMLALSAEGRPTSLALATLGHQVRAVVARAVPDAIALDALVIGQDEGAAARPWPLIDLDASGSFDVAMALAGDVLFFDDVGPSSSEHRVRRAAVGWMP